ncbi:NAD(P)/FAD-dependent oxidoreductase [Thiohalorhabdus sp. Cl-TMA]|uniref:NAD(P)/FAD-dependent oxidoreductase n=1 Tax=Thiohalorhabdus methylotrophus TaxID=3242694 RepID=A0ABV4TXA2_9GAMM
MAQPKKPAPSPYGEGDERHQIVVVGGGAGGMELASQLGNKLKNSSHAAVTLVDGALTHLWKPLLHEVAAGTLDSQGDAVDFLALGAMHGYRFRMGRMNGLDRENQEIRLAPICNDDGWEVVPARRFRYDTLIISVGSVTNDLGLEGVREHCHFLDHRDEADKFHRVFLEQFLHAQTQEETPHEGQLNVAIVGAGATGIELAAELNYAAQQFVEYGLDRITPERHMRITILEAADRILPALPGRVAKQTRKQLEDLGIEIVTGEAAEKITAEGITTQSGRYIPARMKVWAAGIKAPDFLSELEGLETNRRNQLVVDQTLQTSDPNIFAMGDCAQCPWPEKETSVPPRAQAAHQQATTLLRTAQNRLKGKPPAEFHYHDHGSLINLSHYNTVGNLMGNLAGSITIEGWAARVAYRSLYRMHQRVLYGTLRTGIAIMGDWIGHRHRPRLKLH